MGKRVWFPVVSGPLAPYAAGFESWLRSRSYSRSAAAGRLCQLDQLSRWLERRELTAGELSDARVAEFASSRRDAGLVTWTTPQSVALPLAYLREIGVMPSLAATVASGPVEELLADYGRYLFPTRQGQPLSRYTIGVIVAKHAAIAAASCPSVTAKRVTPHTLRHTNAMLLRAKGVDIATIALWLGHESTQTTHIYEHADPALKEQAIARTAPLGTKPGRYRPSDTLLAFLDGL